MAVTVDNWGLAVIKLARQRNIFCDLDVIELQQLLLFYLIADGKEEEALAMLAGSEN